MKPIYEPKGKAKEYGDYAINIYTGCPHGCYYCFAPNVLHRKRNEFHSHIEPRKDVVKEVAKQIERENITDKLIHLCFTCDPYPTGYDTTPTREIIKLLKGSGNHVQILTKGEGTRDFDLLDSEDWYGITYSGQDDLGILFTPPQAEPGSTPIAKRLAALEGAHMAGIKTWVSMEPVLNDDDCLNFLRLNVGYIDKYKIGKLNYWPSDIDWAEFGRRAEALCKENGINYYIKDSLREEMNRS